MFLKPNCTNETKTDFGSMHVEALTINRQCDFVWCLWELDRNLETPRRFFSRGCRAVY